MTNETTAEELARWTSGRESNVAESDLARCARDLAREKAGRQEDTASWEVEKAAIFDDLDIAEATVARLQAALREAHEALVHGMDGRVVSALEIIDAALFGKGEA